MSFVVFDNAGVAALLDPASERHREALSFVEANSGACRRAPNQHQLVTPTTVRVEAGWDRRSPKAANINGLGIEDHDLTNVPANEAARLRIAHHDSPACAHVGAVIDEHPSGTVIVLTSDTPDIVKVAEARTVRIVRL